MFSALYGSIEISCLYFGCECTQKISIYLKNVFIYRIVAIYELEVAFVKRPKVILK